MQRIEWSVEFELGIEIIDAQHKRIVEYINQLVDIDEQAEPARVAEILENLVDYTFSHFAFEESLMEEAGYEFLYVHQHTHEAFTRRIRELHQQFKQGQDVSMDLGGMLQTWLFDHIVSDDRSYAPLVRQKFALIEQRSNGAWVTNSIRRFFGKS
jgi:hemerythrin